MDYKMKEALRITIWTIVILGGVYLLTKSLIWVTMETNVLSGFLGHTNTLLQNVNLEKVAAITAAGTALCTIIPLIIFAGSKAQSIGCAVQIITHFSGLLGGFIIGILCAKASQNPWASLVIILIIPITHIAAIAAILCPLEWLKEKREERDKVLSSPPHVKKP